jgi:site-specific DNA recombinase
VKAAIYARKSTEQNGVAEDQRSVARQVEQATVYARKKGWTVDPSMIFADDGISGAEFSTRNGLQRLLAVVKGKAPFDVLIMSEGSRLGREQVQTAFALMQIVQGGVRVFYYQDDREATLDSPTDKMMMTLKAFADEMEREQGRLRTRVAMRRKAEAGHVTGGRTFGYDNVEVRDATGKRSHVIARINEEQAAVVRRIFQLCASGEGLTAISKTLNAEGCLSPRAQRGRPNGWTASSVRAVLHREKYKGVIVWDKTRKRNRWGAKRQEAKPCSEWLTHHAPELAIVTEAEWAAAHARIAADRQRFGRAGGGRTPGSGAKYMLTGLLKCKCGAGIEARTRQQGGRRVLFYGCSAYQRKGKSVCPNAVTIRADVLEGTVLRAVADDVLSPRIIEEAIRQAAAMWTADNPANDPARHQAELAKIEQELVNLTNALAEGMDFASVRAGIAERTAKKAEVTARLRESSGRTSDLTVLDRHLPQTIDSWRMLLRESVDVVDTAAILKKLIKGKLQCERAFDGAGKGYYIITGEGTLRGALPHNLASPTGFEPVFWP